MEDEQTAEPQTAVEFKTERTMFVERLRKYVHIKWAICAIVFIIIALFYILGYATLLIFISTFIGLSIVAVIGLLIKQTTPKNQGAIA